MNNIQKYLTFGKINKKVKKNASYVDFKEMKRCCIKKNT